MEERKRIKEFVIDVLSTDRNLYTPSASPVNRNISYIARYGFSVSHYEVVTAFKMLHNMNPAVCNYAWKKRPE